MNYMKEILGEIKVRPRMYLSECKLENLYALMNGYMYQIFQEDDIVPEFYQGFQEYIEAKYNVTTGQHWTKIIDFYSENEEEALHKFFQHLEEYTEIDERNEKS